MAEMKSPPNNDPMEEYGSEAVSPEALDAAFDAGLAAMDNGDYPTAARVWLPLAKRGHAKARICIGNICFHPNPCLQDDDIVEGFKWCRSAMNEGDAEAMGRIIDSLSDYYSLESNIDGLTWILLAANQGDAEAMAEIADLYSETYSEDEEAFNWYLKAAERGHIFSQHTVGILYAEGQGAPQDCFEAMKWCCLAEGQGFRGTPQDCFEATKWHRLTAD
jgi:TPR repeat protein